MVVCNGPAVILKALKPEIAIEHIRLPPSFPVMDDLTTERSCVSQTSSCVSQTTRFIDVLGLLFDVLSMSVHTARQWQTPGRLVQELNASTVE